MFGYVSTLKNELKVRELCEYEAWYCGLCHAIKSAYGNTARLCLNYDCTFLALLLSGIDENETASCVHKKCGYKPLNGKKAIMEGSDTLSYAADISVLLFYYKIADDVVDEKSVKAKAGKLLLKNSILKAGSRQPAALSQIHKSIGELSRLERENETSIDIVADTFAQLLKQIVLCYDNISKKQAEALGWLSYNLGRWIYLVDAYHDKEADAKQNKYNPFVLNTTSLEHASFLLYSSLYEMERAYDLLTIHNHKGILDNIIYEGCRNRSKQILEGVNG